MTAVCVHPHCRRHGRGCRSPFGAQIDAVAVLLVAATFTATAAGLYPPRASRRTGLWGNSTFTKCSNYRTVTLDASNTWEKAPWWRKLGGNKILLLVRQVFRTSPEGAGGFATQNSNAAAPISSPPRENCGRGEFVAPVLRTPGSRLRVRLQRS